MDNMYLRTCDQNIAQALNSPWSTGVVLELELEWVAGVAPGGQGGEV